MKYSFIAAFFGMIIYLVLSISLYGFSTVMKCGAIASIPTGPDRCYNFFTGEINLEEE